MNARQSLALGATLILGLAVGGLFSWQPSFAQPKMEQPPVGRYQVAALGRDPNNAAIVVIDTATGVCWKKGLRGADWEEAGFPPRGPRN